MVVAREQDDKFTTEIVLADSTLRPIYAGQPADKHGLGTDMRPGQLVLAGYAACTNMTVRGLLMKDGVEVDDVIVCVDWDTSEEGKTKIYSKIEIVGDLPQDVKDEYIEKAKMCAVRQILLSEKEFLPME